MSDPVDRNEPEGRHEHVVTLLGAYTDDELAPDIRGEVDAHLSRCSRCSQELRVQQALKSRLGSEVEAVGLEASGVLARLADRLAQIGRPPADKGGPRDIVAPSRSLLHLIVAWSGWLVAASLAALWAAGGRRPAAQGMNMAMGPLTAVSVDSVPEPIADAALHDFRRVAQAALPQGPELAAVRSQVPFSVPALQASHMRLIGAWTTTIGDVPTAALAYRCHDRLVVQYVVPEHAFFRPPRVRQAIAAAGVYAAGEGKIHAVGWPGTDNGSFLVGEFTAAELAAMRM
jgi:anti-sigma factor RsiW